MVAFIASCTFTIEQAELIEKLLRLPKNSRLVIAIQLLHINLSDKGGSVFIARVAVQFVWLY